MMSIKSYSGQGGCGLITGVNQEVGYSDGSDLIGGELI